MPIMLDFAVVSDQPEQKRCSTREIDVDTTRGNVRSSDTAVSRDGRGDSDFRSGSEGAAGDGEEEKEEVELSLRHHHEISSQDAMDPSVLVAELGHTLAQFGNPISSSSSSSPENTISSSLGRWAASLVLECAKAVTSKDMVRVQHLLWMLNELASPHGDCEQRLASHFLQAVFCRMTGTGSRTLGSLYAAVERSCSFDSLRKTILKFQEASPWTTFGHVAANGAILEALEGETRAHIVDLSNTFCTQWPTLLEALATRQEGAPHLRLTTIVVSRDQSAMKAMKEVGSRMDKFARLMGVPFEFTIKQSHVDLQPLLFSQSHPANSSTAAAPAPLVDLHPGEALAVNFNQSLHHVPLQSKFTSSAIISPRDVLLHAIREMKPKVVTLIEEEAGMASQESFLARVNEALRFYSLYFESLEESFGRVSNERLLLERAASRSLLNLLACDSFDDHPLPVQSGHDEYGLSSSSAYSSSSAASSWWCEKRERSIQWAARLTRAGFCMASFTDDVVDDVRALLKRYKEGWGLHINDNCLFLTWKDQSVVFTSVWKPSI